MNSQLEQAIRIVKKTGDRLIIVDGSDSCIVMNLDEYERIITKKDKNNNALTEEKLIDKINRDIGLWKSQQNNEYRVNDSESDLLFDNYNDEELYANFESEIDSDLDFYQDFNKSNIRKKKRWTIPKNIKKEAEEIIDEDTQYLERISF